MHVSKSICDAEGKYFFEMKEECKVSYVKLFLWSMVAQKSTNILIFHIFEYGSEYGAECSAKSGTKYYFIKKWSFP